MVIIGAGAAGLMCALSAGQRGRDVVVLERAKRVGKKILMSGGGRCNFTNLHTGPGHFLSQNPHFCKSALSRFTQHDFIALVEKHGVAYHEKTLGQLFCDDKAKDIVNLLLGECEAGGVGIQTECAIESVTKDSVFHINTNLGPFSADALVIATGGLSIPRMGATGFGFTLAKQFGLKVIACDAALVPLVLDQQTLDALGDLAGIAVQACVSCAGQSFREAILFTHKGLSGPAILQISSYWRAGQSVQIDLLPDQDLQACFASWRQSRPKATAQTVLSELLPKRLVRQWFAGDIQNKPLNQYTEQQWRELALHFHQWQILPEGTEGYRTAEVTRGGVDTHELSSKTFEARRVPGLYFIGEVVDVTGWLGGFNFQWAWASGYCAGQFV